MAKTDAFVAMTECHFMNEQSMAEMSYYAQFAIGGLMNADPVEMVPFAYPLLTRAESHA